MTPVHISNSIIFSIKYDGEKEDIFTKTCNKWTDPEYIFEYITKYKRFISNNPFFNGFTLKQVGMEIVKEAKQFPSLFQKYQKNSLEYKHPNLEERFVLLNKHQAVNCKRRKMYGHERSSSMMISVLRLYALKLPSEKKKELPAYLIIGGGIKFTDNMKQMKPLKLPLRRLDRVEEWLKANNIETKEQLIAYITKNDNTTNRMGNPLQ